MWFSQALAVWPRVLPPCLHTCLFAGLLVDFLLSPSPALAPSPHSRIPLLPSWPEAHQAAHVGLSLSAVDCWDYRCELRYLAAIYYGVKLKVL